MILFGSSFGLFYASKCFFADVRGEDDVLTTTFAAIPTGLFIGTYGMEKEKKEGRKGEGRRKREEGRRKKEEGRRKKEEGRRKKEEGRRKKEEGRRKKEEGRRKRRERRKRRLG